jgi:hypothetical protein
VATFALAVAVLLNAALAAAGFAFYHRLDTRIRVLSEAQSPRNLYAARLAPPAPDDSGIAHYPPLDTVGSWALEMEQAGVRVSDAEIALQRKMRLEAGL